MELEYRVGNIDDIEDVFRLNRKVFDEAWSRSVMLESLQVGYDLFVCHQEERLVAYILSQDILFETQVMQLVVDQDFRRQGVAKKLMHMMIQDKQDIDLFILEVRASNVCAQTFYAQMGFEEIAKRPHYYAKTATKLSEDAVVMSLKQIGCTQ